MRNKNLIAMLGGGQLGLMFTEKAKMMGEEVLVLDPDKDCPAGKIANKFINAEFTDSKALETVINYCEVCTTEFENIPYKTLELLEKNIEVFPNSNSLKITQNRILEKEFLKEQGIPTTEYYKINSKQELYTLEKIKNWPYILKTSTFGYDGKGQVIVNNFEELKNAYKKLNVTSFVLEKKVNLKKEISQVAACYKEKVIYLPISENIHINNILHKSLIPADINDKINKSVQTITEKICVSLNYTGIICIEFFIDDKNNVLVNEIAPRTHNSGHYSIEGCNISQFEHQVRILKNLPPQDSHLKYNSVMLNLLGDLWENKSLDLNFGNNKDIFLHLYNKTIAKKGRKMGHFTVVDKFLNSANAKADKLYNSLKNEKL